MRLAAAPSLHTMGNIQRGRVLDKDPVTHFQTICDGTRDNVLVVHEEGPFDFRQISYNMKDGLAVDMYHTQQSGLGQLENHLRLVARR